MTVVIERQALFIQVLLAQIDEPMSSIVICRVARRRYEAWIEGCEKTIGYADGTTANDAACRLYALVRTVVQEKRTSKDPKPSRPHADRR